MSTRIHLVVELEFDTAEVGWRSPGQPTLRDAFEEDMILNSIEIEGALYNVTVLGMGATAKDLAASMKMRAEQRKQLGK